MCICCVTNCCCRNSPMKSINISLLVLISCCVFFSFLTTVIRSAKTSRYEYDLQYLNQTFIEDDSYVFRNLQNTIKDKNSTLRNLRDYYYNNGVLEPQSQINYKSLFKKWEKVEITLNLMIYFFLLKKIMIL